MSTKLLLISLLLHNLWSCEAQVGSRCTITSGDDQGQVGSCKILNECPKVKDAFIRHGDKPQYCSGSPKSVCCPEVVSDALPRPFSNRISAQKCREYASKVTQTVDIQSMGNTVQKVENTCSFVAIKHIIGGVEASEREFPHMALIGYRNSESDFQYVCGGSLISPGFILSAAHCSWSAELKHATYAKLGDVRRGESNPSTFLVYIEERIKHPKYNVLSIDHDIAIYRLRQDFKLNKYVRPICLPHMDESHEKAIATGWGHLAFGEALSNNLMKVTLNIFNETDCQSKYELIGKTKNGIDYETKICAGSYLEQKDTCSGDSGGPLQIYNPDNLYCMYTIVGVTSYGAVNCGTKGMPGVYTRVYPYIDWIEKIVWP